jgi:hypothetical protein
MPNYAGHEINLSDIEEFIEEAHHVYIDVNYATSEDFFIACPKPYLKERPVITSKPIDPIIFQSLWSTNIYYVGRRGGRYLRNIRS